MTAVLEMPAANQRARLETEALSIPNQARQIAVSNQATLDKAGKMLTEVIKPLRAEAADVFDPIIRQAHEAHKAALAGKARVEKPLIEAEGILKNSIGGYLAEQEHIRRQEEARLRAEQEARQREELRLAEVRRLEEERILNEQQEREHAEEIERKLNELPPDADVALVASLCEAPAPEPIRLATEMPVFEPVYVAPRAVAAPAGISTSQKWKAEVVSLQQLCRAIADGKVPAHYVEANMTVLNGMARANKQALNIPGVRAVADFSVTARRA
jgi:hypothetical protein